MTTSVITITLTKLFRSSWESLSHSYEQI